MTSIAILSIAVAVAAPLPKERPKQLSVVGKWVVVEWKTRTGSGKLDGPAVEFTSDGAFEASEGPPGNATSYTADTAKQPPELDFNFPSDSPRACIYKLEEDGTLVICYRVKDHGSRPTKFETSDDNTVLLKLKPVQKK